MAQIREALSSGNVLLVLILCTFALLYGSLSDPIYDVDQIGYLEGARSLIQGRGYVVPEGYKFSALVEAADSGFKEQIHPGNYQKEVHPVLYGYVLAGFMLIFGTSVASASALSVLCGLVSLAIVYRLARLLGGTVTAALATGLTGVSYFFWRASLAVMTEGLSTTFGVAGALLFLRFLRTERSSYLLAASFFYGLATATRPQQIMLVVASAVVYAAARGKDVARDLLPLSMGALLFGLCLIPQYLYARAGTLPYTRLAMFSLDYFWRPEPGGDDLRPAWQILAYLKDYFLGGALIFPPVSLLFLLGAYRGLRDGKREVGFLLLWIGGVFALMSIERYFSLRYIAQAVIPGYLVAAYGFSSLFGELQGNRGKARLGWLTAVVAAGLVGLAGFTSSIAVVATVRAHNVRVAPFHYLREQTRPEDIVIGVDELGRIYLSPFFPLGDRRPEAVARVVGAARKAGRRVFVILRTKRAARAESQYGDSPDRVDLQRYVDGDAGGVRVWEGTSAPPLSKWLPRDLVSRLSESWAIYSL